MVKKIVIFFTISIHIIMYANGQYLSAVLLQKNEIHFLEYVKSHVSHFLLYSLCAMPNIKHCIFYLISTRNMVSCLAPNRIYFFLKSTFFLFTLLSLLFCLNIASNKNAHNESYNNVISGKPRLTLQRILFYNIIILIHLYSEVLGQT